MVKQGARLRATAAEVVAAVSQQGRSLDAALAEFEPAVADNDRALLRFLSYGTLRHWFRLREFVDAALQKPLKSRDRVIEALLAVGLYQLSDTRIPDHAAVSQTVEAARVLRRPKFAALTNAVMRRALRENFAAFEPGTEQGRFDHPQWLLETFRADWPDSWTDIVSGNNARAPMWLRVNPSAGSAAEYQERLAAEDIEATSWAAAPQALCLTEPVPVARLPDFETGAVSVQDGAAQLAAMLLAPEPGQRVLDACAAPGGKSAHLLELTGGDLDLTSVDSDPARLKSVEATLARLGLHATLMAADASKPEEWWDGRPFDAILVDAPCSATGVIRRHPDIKLLRRRADIAPLAALQRRILTALWPLLAPGGRLLYATCSVLKAENDEVVTGFLEATEDATEYSVLQNNNIRDVMRAGTRGQQVLPGTAGLDGFYYAGLTKVS